MLEWLVQQMQTRGWALDSYAFDDSAADVHYTYRISKSVSTREGTFVQHGFEFIYTVPASGDDEMKVYQWNPTSPDDIGHEHANFVNSNTNSSNTGRSIKGRWTFWTSDQDNDSFFLMAEARPKAPIIGFWPPAGSLFTNGSTRSGFNAQVVFSPFTNRYLLHDEYNDGSAGMDVPFTKSGYGNNELSDMDSTQIKTDFAWFNSEDGRPIFLTVGSDIQMRFMFTSDTAGSPHIWHDQIFSATATVITEIGGRYYVSSGDHSKILFDCGTSAPEPLVESP